MVLVPAAPAMPSSLLARGLYAQRRTGDPVGGWLALYWDLRANQTDDNPPSSSRMVELLQDRALRWRKTAGGGGDAVRVVVRVAEARAATARAAVSTETAVVMTVRAAAMEEVVMVVAPVEGPAAEMEANAQLRVLV